MVDNTTTSSGIGQLTPYGANTPLTAVAFIVRQIMALLDTMIPVQVVAVHPGNGTPPTAGTVDVQLLISTLDGAGNSTEQGIVYGLPYFRPQGGPWAIIIDPAKNDFGYIICAARDISNLVAALKAGNSPLVTPGSFRKYNVADGIYVGGALNTVPKCTVWFKPDGTLKISDTNGNVLDTTSGTWVFTGNVEMQGTLKVDELETGEAGLNVTGAITATGEITAKSGGGSSVTLSGHTHTQGVDSHGDTEVPTNSPTAGT